MPGSPGPAPTRETLDILESGALFMAAAGKRKGPETSQLKLAQPASARDGELPAAGRWTRFMESAIVVDPDSQVVPLYLTTGATAGWK